MNVRKSFLRRHGWSDESTRTDLASDIGPVRAPAKLMARYQEIVGGDNVQWTEHHHLNRVLGSGGHGIVFLSEGRGIDAFDLPVALKVFSPRGYHSEAAYLKAMQRIAEIAARVARIQQDNLVNFRHWIDRGQVRILEMEWIDGFDLHRLMDLDMFAPVLALAPDEDREILFDRAVALDGPQLRLKPGPAVSIVRCCLGALAALHKEGIIHGDLKPSNIMIKRTGSAKLIDLAAAYRCEDHPASISFTPLYAAPELFEERGCSPQSDLASLGYILIEMLSGRSPFADARDWDDLHARKRTLREQLPKILPKDVVCNDLLMDLCTRLVAADPEERYTSADHADSEHDGAAAFHRQLVKADLASEYPSDLALWLKYLPNGE